MSLNHLAPSGYGGAGLDRAADRRLHEIFAGAWVLRGRLLLGAGISDVRRFPDRFIAATRTPQGWVFDGTITWVSGWGLNEALVVAAVEAGTRTVVTGLVPVNERTRATPLRLSVVTGSRTQRVTLDQVEVPEEEVIASQSLDEWRHADAGASGDARPHHFGLAATVLRELAAAAHPRARQVAATWAPRVEQIRVDAYGLADEAADAGGGPYRLTDRLALKVAVGEALGTITRALVVARSGHGMVADDTAQLHARAALFVLVQGQSTAVREAQLAYFTN